MFQCFESKSMFPCFHVSKVSPCTGSSNHCDTIICVSISSNTNCRSSDEVRQTNSIWVSKHIRILLFAVSFCFLLFVVVRRCLLFVVCCLLFVVVCCLLLVDCYLLFAASCLLFVVRCLLFVVCRFLLTTLRGIYIYICVSKYTCIRKPVYTLIFYVYVDMCWFSASSLSCPPVLSIHSRARTRLGGQIGGYRYV